jgi:hypothetical protein
LLNASTIPVELVHTLSTFGWYARRNYQIEEEVHMDTHFRKRGMWIAVLALAIVALCMLLALGGTLVMGATRSGPVYLQPPAGEEGAVPLVPHYGPFAGGRHAGAGIVRFVLLGGGLFAGFLVLGLILALLAGLSKRVWRQPPEGGDASTWRPWHGHRQAAYHEPPRPEAGVEPGRTEDPSAGPEIEHTE